MNRIYLKRNHMIQLYGSKRVIRFVFIIIIFFLTSCSFRNINYTKDNKKQGIWIENDKDSIIKITKYRKGKIKGKRIYLYPDGSKEIYYYRNGKQLLISTKIDKDGNKEIWTLSPSF